MTSVYAALAAVMEALPEKILKRLIVTESGCWEWTGAKVLSGYGRVRWESRARPVHRVVYTLLVGDPGDLDLDHLCRNPPCVNPAHLEAVTHAENVRRGQWSLGAARKQLAKTTCANGHEYTEETLYIPPLSSRPQRQCRICRLAAKRKFNAKRYG